jgi:hypothetical protein
MSTDTVRVVGAKASFPSSGSSKRPKKSNVPISAIVEIAKNLATATTEKVKRNASRFAYEDNQEVRVQIAQIKEKNVQLLAANRALSLLQQELNKRINVIFGDTVNLLPSVPNPTVGITRSFATNVKPCDDTLDLDQMMEDNVALKKELMRLKLLNVELSATHSTIQQQLTIIDDVFGCQIADLL